MLSAHPAYEDISMILQKTRVNSKSGGASIFPECDCHYEISVRLCNISEPEHAVRSTAMNIHLCECL
ncbi:hypothetical protein FB451DRAFT_1394973 [Mycena latifolia]|nr:hypothetical protein FB451DRAFT_1394973 [Mycena latifolia]